jgi:hypothetical protein
MTFRSTDHEIKMHGISAHDFGDGLAEVGNYAGSRTISSR